MLAGMFSLLPSFVQSPVKQALLFRTAISHCGGGGVGEITGVGNNCLCSAQMSQKNTTTHKLEQYDDSEHAGDGRDCITPWVIVTPMLLLQ